MTRRRLLILPLLAITVAGTDLHHGPAFFDITALPGWLRLLVVLLAMGFIYVAGTYASRPVFRAIAASRVREVFVAAALALVIGISLLMTLVGLSPALGTFMAGVVLAEMTAPSVPNSGPSHWVRSRQVTRW